MKSNAKFLVSLVRKEVHKTIKFVQGDEPFGFASVFVSVHSPDARATGLINPSIHRGVAVPTQAYGTVSTVSLVSVWKPLRTVNQ
jgi:hypothetical protein